MTTRRRRTKVAGPTYTTTQLMRVRTARGTAAFASIVEPDTAYNKTQYCITVYFDREDPEFQAYENTLKDMAKQENQAEIPMRSVTQSEHEKAKEGKYPELAQPVGTPYYKFACPATEERQAEGGIKIYGPDAKLMTDNQDIWGGDTVRVAGALCSWVGSDGTSGMKVYLSGVQFLKRNRAASSMFSADQDFLSDDAEETEAAFADETDNSDVLQAGDDDDLTVEEDFDADDIPF